MRTPNLLLKPSAYKANKLYSILPSDGGGDFTVSSYIGNGTRVNSEGLIETVASDTPRIDYLGGAGLLLEPTRTNLMTYSTGTSGASWSGGSAIQTANDEMAPDGSKTAVKLEDTSLVAQHAQTKQVTISATTQYTFSIFIKFGNNTGDKVNVNIDLQAGTTASTTNFLYSDGTWTINTDATGIIDDTGSEYYGNGWWRFYATFTSLTGNTSVLFTMYPSYGNFDLEPRGYFWYWGNQLEAGAFMTSLIPTTTGAVERLYDFFPGVDLMAAGLLSYSTGFIVIKAQDLENRIADLTNSLFYIGTTNGIVKLFYASLTEQYPSIRVQSTDATNSTYTLTKTSANIGINVTWDNIDIWVDGIKVLTTSKEFYFTDTSAEIIGIGASWKLKELAIYNREVTDTEAKALTS